MSSAFAHVMATVRACSAGWAAYHAKCDRYGPTIVGTVVSADAARSTLRLVPR